MVIPFLKHQVYWNQFVVQYRVCTFVSFGLLSLLIGRYVSSKVVHVHNRQKPWFDEKCRGAFVLKQEIHLRWIRDSSLVNWEEFVHSHERANETYSEASRWPRC